MDDLEPERRGGATEEAVDGPVAAPSAICVPTEARTRSSQGVYLAASRSAVSSRARAPVTSAPSSGNGVNSSASVPVVDATSVKSASAAPPAAFTASAAVTSAARRRRSTSSRSSS